MTVYGTVFLSFAGGLVALGTRIDAPRMVDRLGGAAAPVATTPVAPANRPPGTVPAASTGLGPNGRLGAAAGPPGAAPSPGAAPGVAAVPGGRGGISHTAPVHRAGPPTADGMPPGGTPVPVEPFVSTAYVTETERIPYRTRVVRDRSMPRGARAQRNAGVPGERTARYEVTTVGGEQTGRRLIAATVTREPVTRVVAVGTGRGNDRPDRGCRHGRGDDEDGRHTDRDGGRHGDREDGRHTDRDGGRHGDRDGGGWDARESGGDDRDCD